MKIQFKKLHKNAVIPKQAHTIDAGFDLTAVTEEWNDTHTHTQLTYDTGIAVNIPEGFVGLLFPRSSIYKTRLNLSNSVGVIDAGYLGSIKAKFNCYQEGLIYNVGDRIIQLVIIPIPTIEFEEVQDFPITERNDKGYGSSGN